ncbi:Hypothetical protein PFR_JS7-PH_15 [Propionibacterium freudenreichii]|nr:Hypothetical protein PFR_JS7-PH_15 [Propionibacterium freudenreichii]
MVVMAASMDSHRPDRVPGLIPARRPAMDRSWHGEPPQITSTGSTDFQSMAVTSPRLGMSGWWASRIVHGPGSTSDTQETRPPVTDCTPMSSPP